MFIREQFHIIHVFLTTKQIPLFVQDSRDFLTSNDDFPTNKTLSNENLPQTHIRLYTRNRFGKQDKCEQAKSIFAVPTKSK